MSRFSSNSYRSDKMEKIMRPMIQDFLAYAQTRTQPEFFWFSFNGLQAPFDTSVSKLSGLLPKGVKAPTEAQLQSYKYLTSLPTSGKDLALTKALYWSAVKEWDENLGLMIAGLQKTGMYDKATIVLVGSSGQSLGAQDAGIYSSPYMQSVHVPLLIKQQDQKNAQVNAAFVSTVAVAPTIREIAGYHPLPQIRSLSLVPLLRGEATKTTPIAAEDYDGNGRTQLLIDSSSMVHCTQYLDPTTLKAPQPSCNFVDLKKNPNPAKHITWGEMTPSQKEVMGDLIRKTNAIMMTGEDPFAKAHAAK